MKSNMNAQQNPEKGTVRKIVRFKTMVQLALFLAVLTTTVLVSYNIYQSIKQVYRSEPAGTGITCFYEMMR